MDVNDTADDQVPPLPRLRTKSAAASPRQVRRRPPFAEPSIARPATATSSAESDQIISSLISSISAITKSAQDILDAHASDRTQSPSRFDTHRPGTAESIYADIPTHRPALDEFPLDNEGDSDEDFAAPPVIRLARGSSGKKKKKPKQEYSSNTLRAMYSENLYPPRVSSSQSNGMGVPSVERPMGSSHSLATSTTNGISRTSQEQIETRTNLSPVRPFPQRSYSDFSMKRSNSITPVMENEKENDDPRRSIDTFRDSSMSSTHNPNGEAMGVSAMTLLNRGDLQEHLIPSRRSSIRRKSTAEESEVGHRSSDSRDLRDLNIDEDLLGSNDSTVQRIRELHEAREKRQLEWRKEARKSTEKSTRRQPSPGPKSVQRTTTYPTSKLSVTEVLVESEHESTPNMSATITANDLEYMPAFISNDEPLTPQGQLMADKQLFPPSATTTKMSPVKRSRPSSISFKRTSGISAHTNSSSEPVKSISEEVDAFLAAPRLSQKIRHPRTGRTIAFSEVGDPQGFVVICCVGMGLTRYVTTFYDELARTLKLRIITPDRPGVGESESVAEKLNNPLTWVDDVAVICASLEISRFSLLAHSAGSVYALATALKMPQFVRGRIHLLAPWIPPSQMPKGAAIGPDSQPLANLPMSHRILSVLPSPILKVANSRFLSTTTASGDSKSMKGKKNKHFDSLEADFAHSFTDLSGPPSESFLPRDEIVVPARSISCYQANNDQLTSQGVLDRTVSEPRVSTIRNGAISPPSPSPRLTPEARASLYNQALTHRIWSLAKLNANPAIDLMMCFERKKPIGFRYAEVTRSVVIHHGAKDTRVPLDNVRWLQTIMKRCELRVVENEGHSLMASAAVMGSVLTEIAKEWDEWAKIAKDKEKRRRDVGNGNGHGNTNGKESVLSFGSDERESIR